MKQSLWLVGLFFMLLVTLPQAGYSAIAKPRPTEISSKKQEAFAEGKQTKRTSFREKIGGKVAKFKQKFKRWKDSIQLAFPSGKLLTSLIFLVLSIVLFAVGGLTSLGVLFNALGSAAVIVALLFFVLWLMERTNMPKPTD